MFKSSSNKVLNFFSSRVKTPVFIGCPAKILRRMFWAKWIVHFTRNNARSRYFYYHAFIGWVGRDNWSKVEPKIRNAWEEALSSFDKQYGVMKSLKHINDNNKEDMLFLKPTKEKLNEIINKNSDFVINLSEKKKKMSESERELFVALGELKIKDFSDDSLEKQEWEAIKKYLETIETSKTSETSEKSDNTDENEAHENKSDVIIAVINCQ